VATPAECMFHRGRCRPTSNDQLRQLRESSVLDFIQRVCSVCIKDRYSRAKMKAVTGKYVVVNTL